MLPLAYAETGPYDTALDLRIGADGGWEATGGSYVSYRRAGRLAPDDLRRLTGALARLAPDDEPAPAGDFPRTLAWTVGTRNWQGPPPTGDPALTDVLALLRTL